MREQVQCYVYGEKMKRLCTFCNVVVSHGVAAIILVAALLVWAARALDAAQGGIQARIDCW